MPRADEISETDEAFCFEKNKAKPKIIEEQFNKDLQLKVTKIVSASLTKNGNYCEVEMLIFAGNFKKIWTMT